MAEPQVPVANPRCCLSLLAFLTVFALMAVSAFGELQDETRSRLALATALMTAVLYLTMWPSTRPPAEEEVPRSAHVARTGRLVMALAWIVRSVVYGFATYLVTDNLNKPGFHAGVAALSAFGQLLTLLSTWGSDRAGFPVDWSFLRGLRAVRHVLRIGVAALIAGYAATLAQAAESAFSSGPGRVFHAVRDLGLWGWSAVLVTVVLCLFAVFVVVLVESGLQRLAARLIGRDNAVGSWLEENAPARIERIPMGPWEGMRIFHFDFIVQLTLPIGGFGAWLGEAQARNGDIARMRAYERGMSHADQAALRERVCAATAAVGPDGWQTLTLEYHAVADHEELVLTVNADRRAPDEYEERRVLHDFAELDALRQLRAANYKAGYGAPFSQQFRVERAPVDSYAAESGDQTPWRLAGSALDFREPPWRVPPTRRQYRADLKRFPISRPVRPLWLRARLHRLPW
jgi:hypothetical protein